MIRSALLLVAVAACRPAFDLADREDIFALPGDKRVMCAASMEWPHIDQDVIDEALDRAHDDTKILQLFAHDPGETVDPEKLEMVFADATARGLTTVTYRELAGGVPRQAALAFSFDDWYVDHWAQLADMMRRYQVRATFFVGEYDTLGDAQKEELRMLAHDGHDIEYHSTRHQNAPEYAAKHGVDAYVANEIDPGLAAMRADGWDPIVFAYPYGHRSDALDHALFSRFTLLRSIMRECPKSEHEAANDVRRDLGDEIDEPLTE